MIRKTQMYFKMTKMVTDIVAILLALMFLLNSELSLIEMVISALVVFVGMSLMKGYSLGDPLPFWHTVRRVLYITSVSLLSIIAVHPVYLNIVEVINTVILASIYMIGFRVLIEWYESRYYRAGRGQIPVLIVGNSRAGDAFIKKHVEDDSLARLKIVGFLDNTHKTAIHGIPYLGKLLEMENRIISYNVEAIVQVGDPEQAITITAMCQRFNLDYFVLPSLLGTFSNRVTTVDQGGFPLITVRETNLVGWDHLYKRIFDLIIVSMLSVILLPVLLLVAIAVMIERKTLNPFVKEMRIDGRTCKKFYLWRFKTLRDGEREPVLTGDDLTLHSGSKLIDNGIERSTKLGKILRRFELNELPQLFNVFNNSMSLIGPRPPFKEEIAHYTNLHYKRLRLKPGVTGLWQVEKDKTKKTLDDLLKLDIYYVENWSTWLDFGILWKTMIFILRKIK